MFFILSLLSVATAYNSVDVCREYNSKFVTSYAPSSDTDVNYTHFQNVSLNMNPQTCSQGYLTEPFKSDFLKRFQFYRWITGLNPVSLLNSPVSQKCALMMAMNYNKNSIWYKPSIDPHTVHDGWTCVDDSSRYSNIYAGQSVENPYLMKWQTTPAHILRGFIDDLSSSKVGHRQTILCPSLTEIGVGHVCFWSGSTVFCGGCQSYNEDVLWNTVGGIVIIWPPNGSIPYQLLSTHPLFKWSIAYISNNSNIPRITVNNITVTGELVYTLCSPYKWIVFAVPQIQQVMNVVVTEFSTIYKYTVNVVNCSSLSSIPESTVNSNAPTGAPSKQPSQQPTSFPTAFPTNRPSLQPTFHPTEFPTNRPSQHPYILQSNRPSQQPSIDSVFQTTHINEYTTEYTTDRTQQGSTATTVTDELPALTIFTIVIIICCIMCVLGIVAVTIYRYTSPFVPTVRSIHISEEDVSSRHHRRIHFTDIIKDMIDITDDEQLQHIKNSKTVHEMRKYI